MADLLTTSPTASQDSPTTPALSIFNDGSRFINPLGFLDPMKVFAFDGSVLQHQQQVTVTTAQSGNNGSSGLQQQQSRNSTKTLKCPKCNWHYKYQEALENHLKDKHPDVEITCVYCIQNLPHPKLARGETYSCGYKPFRCSICNYSTTTKGNLSIHMQSDKHLHAVQEMPANIGLGFNPSSGVPSVDPSDDKPFHCLVCGTFTTASLNELFDHLNVDRSTTSPADVTAHGGTFQCFLCPYNTNLKANFQLHMRTDKHVQRVQLANHMRESSLMPTTSTGAPPSNALLCRLANFKNVVQVRCRPCHDVLASNEAIQDHCQSANHLARVKFASSAPVTKSAAASVATTPLSAAAAVVFGFHPHASSRDREDRSSEDFSSSGASAMDLTMSDNGVEAASHESHYRCKKCDFSTDSENRAIQHLPFHEMSDSKNSLDADSLLDNNDDTGDSISITAQTRISSTHSIPEDSEEIALLCEMGDARLACRRCNEDTNDAAGGGPGAGFMAVSLEEFERHIADHSASASASADDSGTQNGGSDQLQHMDTSSEEVATVPSADVSSEDKSDPTGRLDTSTSESEPTEAEETDQLLKCNLCEEVTDAKDLAGHFVDEHKLTTDVAKKFALAVTSPAEEGPCGHVHQPSPVYRYHCPMCPMVFRTPESLQRHGIRHLFEASHKCSRCARAFKSFNTLKNHLATKHGIMDADVNDGNHCSICRETFPDRQALQTHVYSIDHLHKAKKFLESQSQGRMGRQLNDQVMSMLSAIPKKQTDLKPYKCNVCRLSYGQGSTLDIHLRSVAHQNRMGRLAELLAAGEVEACLPVSEQPGGIPQKTIGELVLPATNSEIERLKNSSESTTTTAMDVASSAAAAAISAIRKRKCEPADAASSPLSAVLQMAASGQLPFFNAFNPENAENGMPPDLSGVLQSLLNRQPLSSREPSPLNSNGPGTANSPTPDEEAIVADEPRTGKSLWVTLEDFGIDLVQQFFKDIRSKRAQIERLDDAVLAELLRVNCPNCNLDFGSIWLLRAHAASAHGTASIPLEAVQQFSEKLKRAIEDNDEVVNDAPELKRIKLEEITSSLRGTRAPHLMSGLAPTTQASHKSSRPSSTVSSAATTPAFDASNAAAAAMMQMAMSGGFGMMNPLLGMMNPELMFSGGLHGGGVNPPSSTSQGMPNAADIAAALGQQRRARTKITDDQLRVLKTYFDINNSPSEAQVKEMSQKTGLAEKVIKHWFRNTLFKERQRDKDSPYNFNIPPQMSIDLDTYEKTGEAKILPVKTESFEASSNTQSASTSPRSTSDCLAGSSAVVPGPEKLLEKSVSPQPVQATVKAEPVEAPTPQANTPAPELANEFLATLKALNNNLMNNPFAFFNQGVAGFGGGDPAAAMAAAAAANPLAAMFSSMGGGGGSTPSGLENLGSTMSASNNNNNNNNNQQMPVSSGSGRRANRTRFTDVQLRTLQQFFDKQAYPKDDDLEMLSKKLNLSPRVIVVWFQNARQKARKIYENTPNLDNNERFVRTPGQNFQCKRCSIVFPRYYELIQHQQKVCYVNDNDAQQTDNKSVDGSLSDEEKPTTSYDMAPGAVTSASSLTPPNYGGHGENSSSTSNAMETLAQLFASNSGAAGQSVQLPTTSEELLKFLTAPNTNCTVQPNETLSKMLENQQMGHSSFCKRCPLCGSAFHQRHALIDHLASRHPDRAGNIDVDSLPEAELSTSMSENPPPLDLSSSVTTSPPNEYNGHNRRDSTPSFFDTDFDLSSVMTVSPGLLASSLFANSAPGSMCSSGSPQPGALNGGMSNNGSSSSASASAAAAAAAAKRYRTHLTPQQVYVMKALFNDYKTPSMTECDMLGREIGLNKRVVQVWFQNARAKERKCRSVTGDEDLPKTDPDHCLMCGVNFLDTPRGKVTMQDHIFTGGHISKLSDRFNIRNVGENKRSSSSGVEDMLSNGKSVSPGFGATDLSSRQRARAVRDSGIRKPQSVSNEALVGGYPYNMMCIPNGASLPMYDAAVIGVPIAALQIPPAVMAQISSDLAAGKEFTKFTQDGLSLADLRNKISEDDFACARAVTSEVGCACPGCSHTFQQSVSLDTHQKLFCSSVEGKSFKLLQIHYECSVCHVRMGTQDEFKKHIEALTHVEARFRNPPQFSVPNLAAVSQ